jgi:signal transduction histidine kinase
MDEAEDGRKDRSMIPPDADEFPGEVTQSTPARWSSIHTVTRAYWVVLVVLGVLQAVSFYHLTQREEADRRQEASQRALLDLQKLLADVEDAQADERGFLITGDSEFLQPYQAASREAREAIKQLRNEAQPTAGAADEIGQAAIDALDDMDEMIAARRGDKSRPPAAVADNDVGEKALQRVRAAIARVSRGQEEATGQRSREEAAAVRRGVVTYVMVSVADLVLLGLGYWGLQRYVAHRRRVEQALAEAWRSAEASRAEAETANRAKDRILATVSHDLRTPLSGIMLWAEVAHSATREPEVLEALAAITESAQAQARLVEDLLDASRALSKTLRMEMQPIDFAEVVRRGCEAVRPTALAKQVRLSVDVPVEGTWEVLGDRLRLQQVVWNIVGNAVKFTPEGGEVDVSLRRSGGANDGDGERLILSVRDNGAGIDAQDLPHLFEPFFQAQSKEVKRADGVGLGLAIVKQLIERHGGKVEVSSGGVGAGTTFMVMLPRLTVAEVSGAERAPELGAA